MQHNNTVLAPLASVLIEGLFLLTYPYTSSQALANIAPCLSPQLPGCWAEGTQGIAADLSACEALQVSGVRPLYGRIPYLARIMPYEYPV